MRKLILFFILMTAMVVNAQTKNAVQEVRDYLHECGVFYIATGMATSLVCVRSE